LGNPGVSWWLTLGYPLGNPRYPLGNPGVSWWVTLGYPLGNPWGILVGNPGVSFG